MRTRVAAFSVVVVVAGALLSSVAARPALAVPLGPGDVADRVLVRLAPGTPPSLATGHVEATVARSRRESDGGTYLALRVRAGTAATVAAELGRWSGVRWAEPDRVLRAAVEPNDACYQGTPACTQTQVGVQVDQNDFRIMHAPDAWSITEGSSAVRVAVLDTKVDTNHIDLQGKVDVGPEFLTPRAPENCNANEVDHGTHVTGTIAAATDNSLGVAGLGWNTRVLSLRVLDDCGIGFASDIADGIRAAADAGCRIINMSFTGDASFEMRDAVAAVQQQGVLVVAAAGNDSTSDPNRPGAFPAAYPAVMGVAATSKVDDRIAPFSNFGLWVPVAAPGVNIWSTAPNDNLESETGTSMAAPHVAAVAALVLAEAPDLTGPEIAAIIERSAVPIEGTGTLVRYGRVDAGAAVIAATQRPPVGYRLVASDGGIFAFGLGFFGSTGNIRLNRPVVAASATPTGNGYWLAGTDGGIFAFGDAGFLGSMGATRLNQPIVAMAPTPTGRGYWMTASDGGIFAFGDAQFFGSTGGFHLNRPVVGMAVTPDGAGYWLVGSDGGLFTFGDAHFQGSTGNLPLNKPIVAMASTRSGNGYWLVASDGGIFAFGDAQFFGSTGNLVLNKPIVTMIRTPSGNGYWLVASDGGIFAFGDAQFLGSTGNIVLNQPIVAAG